MHELAIATSLLEIAKDEMHRHGAKRLLLLRVRHGALANVVPEALQMGFNSLIIEDEALKDARLEMIEEPLILRCGDCLHEFTPEASMPGEGAFAAVYNPCPKCGQSTFHEILQGKELFLDHLEAE